MTNNAAPQLPNKAAKLQEYWDAVLIKKFRQRQRVHDAVDMWERLTGCVFVDHAESLRRAPWLGMPWSMQVTLFCDRHLPKIADRLWQQDPSKDVALLNKLQTSTYTTLRIGVNRSSDAQRLSHSIKKDMQVMALDATKYNNRNQKTDWNVTKSNRAK